MHETATYHHALYVQLREGDATAGWIPSPSPLGDHVRGKDSAGIINAKALGYQRLMVGSHPNVDVFVKE